MHIIKQLQKLINSPENQHYLLAVSGGADSMVLAYLFNKVGLKFHIAHINYHLRGEDSNLDQRVVEDFCKINNIPFHLYEVSEKDEKPNHSIQLWARDLRYRFFKEIQEKENLPYLVTAHHLNDQLETFIINLSKASGIKGLCGIPSHSNNRLRPLLDFSKEEIYNFAKTHHIKYREDLSNQKTDYLRNKIRHNIVPELLETNEQFLENFRRSMSFLNQTKDFVEEQVSSIENSLKQENSEDIILDKIKLKLKSTFIQFEILKKYGFTQESEISKIFSAETGSFFYSEHHQLLVNRNELIISLKTNKNDVDEEIILCKNKEEASESINLAEKLLQIDNLEKNLHWKFNSDTLVFPLILRRKKEGDVFYPIGFNGKKKISKFFKDEKLSILAKQKTWILVDGNDSVLGVLPYRQDRRYAANEETQHILNIFNEI